MVVTSKKLVWMTLAVALVTHALLISFQTSRRIDTSFVRVWLLDSLAPMEKIVERSLYGVGYVWKRYFALIGLHDENRRLRSEIDELRVQLARQQEQVREAERLRALLGLQDSGLGNTVIARVIGRDPARNNETVTIDKGRSHGVKTDSAVITPEGVVGRVLHAGNFFSVVQLILDPQSGVGVMVRSTRRQGILKGTGGRELALDYIDDDNELREGDEFITSGLDRVYPKGLPVGIIVSVGPRRGLFRSVAVRPNVDFGRLEEVICVVDRPEDAEVRELTEQSGSIGR
jgi:rod shape-determining protein MreC